MDWADEEETQEVLDDMNRRPAEPETPAEPAAAAQPEGARPLGASRGGRSARGGSRGGRGGRDGPRGSRPPRTLEMPKEPPFRAFIAFFPDTWKDEDMRRFLTTDARTPVAPEDIVSTDFFRGRDDRPRCTVELKTLDALAKAIEAHRMAVAHDRIVVEPALPQRERPYRRGDDRDRRPGDRERRSERRPFASGARDSRPAAAGPRENPFGAARANDKSMETERRQIEEDQQRRHHRGPAGAPASDAAPAADAAAAKPAEGAAAAAPAPKPAAKPAAGAKGAQAKKVVDTAAKTAERKQKLKAKKAAAAAAKTKPETAVPTNIFDVLGGDE